MALLDDIKDEIRRAHAPKVREQTEHKPEKTKRQKPKTKEEIAAYIARKQAEEERRYLKQREGQEAPKAKKPRAKETPKEEESERKPRRKKIQGSTCTKCGPKHVQTIDLPDGGSIVIIYMSGAASWTSTRLP